MHALQCAAPRTMTALDFVPSAVLLPFLSCFVYKGPQSSSSVLFVRGTGVAVCIALSAPHHTHRTSSAAILARVATLIRPPSRLRETRDLLDHSLLVIGTQTTRIALCDGAV